MPRKKFSASPSPQGGGNDSGKGYRGGRGSERGFHPEHGPRLNEDVCISEEVKIGINLAVERFRLNEEVTELEFPSSLTATERAYVHRLCDELEFKHKSTGKGSGRYITIKKKPASSLASCKSGTFQLVRNSRFQITNLLQRFPVSSRERLELLANTDKSLVNEVSKELARTATGRLNNGVAQVPPPRMPSELQAWTQCLPINQYRDLILHTMNNNQICLVSGETGSGKTTQVPQMILDDCYATNRPCRIFCTQPRRIAALSISERVAAERSEQVGQTVGFQIRLESRVSPKTLLTFCTNGVLLRTLMGNDKALSTVTHVVVDEVHERDRFCDFLLLNLRELTHKNPHLKVILMSATMNTDLFSQYFGGCPVVTVPGNLFPVEQFFLEDVLKRTGHTTKKMESFNRSMINSSHEESRGCEELNTWFNSPMSEPVVSRNETGKNGDSAVPDLTHMSLGDNSGTSGGVSEERDEVEPWVAKEMDEGLAETFLTGNEDSFSQVLHLIMSENVSVDYQHSVTTITPLITAAGRGFTSHVEQLLSVGADPELKAANGLTALDFARKFQHEDIVAMLEATMLATEQQRGREGDGEEEDEELEGLTEEDRQRLLCYQHCWNDDKVDITLITSLLYTIVSTQKEGAVLIFLPGYDEIVSLRDRIDEDPRFGSSRYSLFLLHSSMQSTDQKKVFRPSPPGIRKIILATNIAETSITINDVVYVIDSGKVKVKSFDALLQSTVLRSYWISKASAAQRKGRAGRVQAGVCFHLFSRVRYSHMSEYETPEILRTPLQELCLQTKLLAPVTESIQEYLNKAPEPPPYVEVKSALTVLKQMDALDCTEELTELGRHLADLPIEPHLGKMVLNSIVLKCLDPVLTIVCSLSYKEPFLLPSQSQEKRTVNQIKKDFSVSTFSDHMALLRVFQSWQKARTDGWERAFCSKFYVSPAVMEMIVGIRAQLLGQLRASGFVRARGGGDIRDLNTNSENWAVVKAALCAGAYPSLIRVDKSTRKKPKLVSQNAGKVLIHPSSVIPKLERELDILPSDWLFYEEMTRSGMAACVRCCTIVSALTVAIFAGPAKLPGDALQDAPMEVEPNAGFHGETSDSENDDPEDNKLSTLQLGDWISFKNDAEATALALQLRQKWHCLFLRRMRAPSRAWSQMDEAVINALVNVLTNEEQALGLQQPAGIGQRPRPMSAESILTGGYSQKGASNMSHRGDMGMMEDYPDRQRFSTSAKKATSTPPKRKDFLSPKLMQSGSDSSTTSPSGASHSSTPCGSPQLGPGDTGPCRYFIMKCNSQRNIDMSISKGAWATSKTNEKRLNKAFQEGKTVHLIFSVQGSGHFQGVAKMSSIIGTDRSSDFNGQGGIFSVDWVKRGNMQFQGTHHLLNPWNDNKRVQVSRDGQELEPSVGEALVRLWDQFPDNSGDAKEDPTPARWAHGNQYNQSYTRSPGSASQSWRDGGRHDRYQGDYESKGYYQDNQSGYYDDSQSNYENYGGWSGGWTGYQKGNQHQAQRHYNRGQGYGNYNTHYSGYQGQQHQQQHEYQHRGSYQYGNHGDGAQQHRKSPVMILQRDGSKQKK